MAKPATRQPQPLGLRIGVQTSSAQNHGRLRYCCHACRMARSPTYVACMRSPGRSNTAGHWRAQGSIVHFMVSQLSTAQRSAARRAPAPSGSAPQSAAGGSWPARPAGRGRSKRRKPGRGRRRRGCCRRRRGRTACPAPTQQAGSKCQRRQDTHTHTAAGPVVQKIRSDQVEHVECLYTGDVGRRRLEVCLPLPTLGRMRGAPWPPLDTLAAAPHRTCAWRQAV